MAVLARSPRSPRKAAASGWCSPWFLFVMGCTLGHLHGRYFESNSSCRVISTMTPLPPHPGTDGTGDAAADGNGWQSIHVFVGNTTPELLPEQQQQQRRWYSQARQDELVIGLLRNKTNGYFVDLAANDAWELSNTYALEHFYGWNGVCIEPNPIYWQNLTQRKCKIVGAVVGAERMQEVYFRFEAGDHGGIADSGFDNGRRWQQRSEKRYTVPLLEILQDQAGAPTEIDYLSLDVEGAETFIMTHFPLNRYRIKLITAERLKGPIRAFLKSHGYEFVQRLTSWGESLWVHASVRDELDWSVMERFGFPL